MTISNEEAEKIGQSCLEAKDGNLFIGSFAAELIGESYPVTKSMWDIIFKNYTLTQLGFKLAEWTDKNG